MKYFLHKIIGKIKKPTQIKTKQISKRGKDKVQKRFFRFWLGEIFLLLF